MPPLVHVHGFETSNNMKVRVALGFKGIAYLWHKIDPSDRGEIQRLSGQFLTPVLQHGDRVLFDSAAILRYLDANFPDTPKLFGESRDEQWQIEDHELFARTSLAGPMLEVVHTKISGGTVDSAMLDRCSRAFGVAAEKVANDLGGHDWLVGGRMTAADITAAAVLHRIRVSQLLRLPEVVGVLESWEERVMAFDGPNRVQATP